VSSPRARAVRYAAATVAGLTASPCASARTVGSAAPAASRPPPMAASRLTTIALAVRPEKPYCTCTFMSLYYNELRQGAQPMSPPVPFPPAEAPRLRRLPPRGVFEREAVYRILDEALTCHVGFVVDGQPFVIPTIHARVGDRLVLHGSAATRMLRTIAGGVPVCVTLTPPHHLLLSR